MNPLELAEALDRLTREHGYTQEALAERLDEAMAFFYPRADWEAGESDPGVDLPRMNVKMGVLRPPKTPFSDLKVLKKNITKAQDKST